MKPKLLFSTVLLLAVIAPDSVLHAADANSPEARMREALRNTMLQLRDAQNQVSTLQASQAESDKEKADLKTQVETLSKQLDALTKQNAADKDASEKTIAGLNSKVTDKDTQISKLNEALEKWKAGYNQVYAIAREKEAARSKLAADNIELQRTVADREAKNRELFKTGNEILTRYEKFSLGDALTAKEPFVGTTRVKLENLVQDYADKLLDQRVAPDESTPAKSAVAGTETAQATTSGVSTAATAP